MLRDVLTKDLVKELQKRQGINTYKGDYESLYKIEVINYGLGENSSTSIIKSDSGPVIILEVVD